MKKRPLLLDLFCCAGGAARGYHEAGFDVVGVDKEPQPRYPYTFVRGDALRFLKDHGRRFAFVHASPPCQRYSVLAKRNGNAHEHPDLVAPTRRALERNGQPWAIENVVGAPLRAPVLLCGTMFSRLRVIRHRLFETSFEVGPTPPHRAHPLCHTFDRRKAHFGKTDGWKDFVQVTGGCNCTADQARDAMGIPWMTKEELNQAVPPAYTRWVGRQWMWNSR